MFPVGNLDVELMKYSTYGGRSGQTLSAIAGLVGSGRGQVSVLPDRVGFKKSDP